jgi:hypothetical protein
MSKTKETKVASSSDKPKKTVKMHKSAERVESSSESDNDSSSDSSSNSSSASDSDSDDSDSDLDAMITQTQTQKEAAKAAPAAQKADALALKTAMSTAKQTKSSDKASKPKESRRHVIEPASQAVATEWTPPAIVAPQPFNPPLGYKPLTTKTHNSSTVNDLFDSETLASSQKQIWHITAPSSVPLSNIKHFSLAAIADQTTLFSHKGTDYTLTSHLTPATSSVLLPSTSQNAYTPLAHPITKSLALTQHLNLPSLSAYQTLPNTASRTPAVPQPRPQPAGLRMRCKPPGFGDDEPGLIGSSEDESEVAAKQAEKSAGRISKRKRDAAAAGEDVETPKNEKKRRKAAEAERRLAEGTRNMDPETEKARRKKEKKEKKEQKALAKAK